MPLPPLDLCPAGYRFYQCSDSGFSGCCSVDPCDIKTCPVASSPAGMSQTTAVPSTTLITSTSYSGKDISSTTASTPTSGSIYIVPLTVTASSLFETGPAVATESTASASADSSSRGVNTSGAIIGGVIGGTLTLITLITALIFWSALRKRSATKIKHQKWASDESSFSGRAGGGYGESIFDSYLSNGENDTFHNVGLVGCNDKHTKCPTVSPANYTNAYVAKQPMQPPPCIFPATNRIESNGSTRYFHIPNSSSPRFFKHADGNSSDGSLYKSSSAQTDTSDSSDKASSVPGGVPVPRSTRSVSRTTRNAS